VTYSLTGRNSATGVNPGDLVLVSLAAEHNFANHWNFTWEVNGRHQGDFKGPGGALVMENSTIIFLTPGLQYTRLRKGGQTTVEASVQIPFIRAGDQPTIPDYELHIGAYTIF